MYVCKSFCFILKCINFITEIFVFATHRYETLLELGRQRRQKLEESCKAYQLVREAGELSLWITDKVSHHILFDLQPFDL